MYFFLPLTNNESNLHNSENKKMNEQEINLIF